MAQHYSSPRSPRPHLVALTLLGSAFWFFLAFPFENHNESYLWVAQLGRLEFLDALTRRFRPINDFRPLGNITAWLTFRVSDGSVYLQQLVNYAFTAAAWMIVLRATSCRNVFALAALVAGGVLFSGYIFLFHLHGVFYGPLLLLLSILLAMSRRTTPTSRTLLGAALATAVAAAYHPFALPMFVAYLVGYYTRHARSLTSGQWLLGLALFAMVGLAWKFAEHRPIHASAGHMWQGLVASYRMVEVRPVIGVVSLALAALTAVATPGRRAATFVGAVAIATAAACIAADLPLLFAWIAAAFAKSVALRSWSVAALVAMTSILATASSSGSPTYTVFPILACAFTLAMDAGRVERFLAPLLRPGAVATLVVIAVGLAAALRTGVQVPLASRLAHPILAEREKTMQLKRVTEWVLGSPYRDYMLHFCERPEDPVHDQRQAVNRRTRPPTGETSLNKYLASRRSDSLDLPPAPGLRVCFGGQEYPEGARVFSVPGRYNGAVHVFDPRRNEVTP